MDLIFCTLFDSKYIDKGLVLYDSMLEHMEDFKLYVFAFDDVCAGILKKLNLDKMTVIELENFESESLLEVKKQRTRAEYCWTCSPWIVKYVLEVFNEPICTYIDADMMFFDSPQCVFDDMRANNCSTIIVPHRFKNEREEKIEHDKVGSYCVEFNTFVNDINGLKTLNWWAERCLEWCYYSIPGSTEWYGDQKYLNVFPERFEGVYICNNIGIGLAPWNTVLITEPKSEHEKVCIEDRKTGEISKLILYHFESAGFITEHIYLAPSGLKSKRLHQEIYDDYIERIKSRRKEIRYEFNFKIEKKHRVVTNNPIMRLYHKYLLPFRKIRNFKDLYWINED